MLHKNNTLILPYQQSSSAEKNTATPNGKGTHQPACCGNCFPKAKCERKWSCSLTRTATAIGKRKNITYILQEELMKKEEDQITNLPYMWNIYDFFKRLYENLRATCFCSVEYPNVCKTTLYPLDVCLSIATSVVSHKQYVINS